MFFGRSFRGFEIRPVSCVNWLCTHGNLEKKKYRSIGTPVGVSSAMSWSRLPSCYRECRYYNEFSPSWSVFNHNFNTSTYLTVWCFTYADIAVMEYATSTTSFLL